MRHPLCLILALMASLALPAVADAAPKRKPAKITVSKHTKGYGFLPGYRPPPPQGPIYETRRTRRAPFQYDYETPRQYIWGGTGNWHTYRNRMMGPIFGPCWQHTPIGPTWTCG